MNGYRVRVRRDRPSPLSWSLALAVTMLAVYTLTLNASLPDAVERVSAAPRVTREVVFDELEGWCASLGAWPAPEIARIEAAGCVSSGAAGCVWEADGDWHVLGAMYRSKAEAEGAVRKLRSENGLSAEVLELSADRVRLRVTAPERQIELIEGAERALREQSEQLNDLARQLDRGEVQPEAARSLCALAASEVGDLRESLSAIPGAEENALCSALIDALDNLAGQLDAVARTRQTASPALSGMLRLAGIDSFLALKDIQDGLMK